MNRLKIALAPALALALVAVSPTASQAQGTTPAAVPQRTLKITPKAQPAIIALQTAVNANNTAAIPGLLAAAQAAAKSTDDRYAVASLQLKAANAANDYSSIMAAADVIGANGGTVAETSNVYLYVAQKQNEAKNYPAASAALDKAIALDPNNTDLLLVRSDLLYHQQRVPESISSLTDAINRAKSAGKPVPQNWYEARLKRAYDAKLPTVYGFSRDWVASSPTPAHWRDTVNIYRNLSGQTRPQLIDMLRLARATKSLSGEGDYTEWAQTLMDRGYPVEALALLQEGEAAGSLKMSSPGLAPFVASARARSPQEKAAMQESSRTALSDPTAKSAMRAGDGNFDAGNYAQAAMLYRAALGKSGVDKDLANLRLGMALTMSGDKAGAMAALQTVGGTQSETAKYWMTYAATRA